MSAIELQVWSRLQIFLMQNLTAKFVFLAYVASVTLAQGLHGLSGCTHGHAPHTHVHAHAHGDHGHHHHQHDHAHASIVQTPRTIVLGEVQLRSDSHAWHDCSICHFLQQNLTYAAATSTDVAQEVARSLVRTLPASPQLAIFSPVSPRAPPVV
ncbi:hypothetical protein M4951_02190 [Blastopirellula sp. J2-11]|uniref:hypothetical protein n=1 Tax=Blastopirellula sp. J2-11 TaxID=2943192 RepID=UPI0021C7281A|nr:hypothetical protein [Blastopirellula sp. J2-11]UUO07131.1 hypothetical protein M4951_02190 [Blastopirellula sp. J2-11]